MADEKKGSARRSALRVLVAAVALAFCLSSGMVGFLLGRNAVRPSGQLIDTILLTPGEASATATVHFLSGRLLDENGGPRQGLTVQLGDETTGVTDEEGRFYLSGLLSGAKTLTVLDEDGRLLGGMELALDFSGHSTVYSELADGAAVFHMPEETRLLEVTLTVDEDNGLAVEEDTARFVTKDGQVADFDGSALKVAEQSQVLTAGGALVEADGSLWLPAQGLFITARGEEIVIVDEETPLTAWEDLWTEDGFLLQEGGAVLLSNGEVRLSGGDILKAGSTLLLTEETVEPLEALPDEFLPAPLDAAEPEAPAEVSPEDTVEPAAAEPAAEAPAFAAAADDAGAEPSQEEETGGLQIYDDVASWRQQSIIDLFRNRTSGQEIEEEDGIMVVAPGSKGCYEFRLENREDYAISYTVSIGEKSFHLPMRFSLLNQTTQYPYLYRQRTRENNGLLQTKTITIPANSEQVFRIDWEWPYEDVFRMDEDDALDTAAATQTDRLYLIAMNVSAQQVAETPAPAEGETRTPGRR